ncbi:MAG: epoxyqueuosine reductase QueH [Acholeplasmatales bacterium]|jgi:predicted adenine nucleotide alpha hydrolase (AANH) superfamily ATPase|nr:epoxyqueuosine reductase QueH [Acholeplasmatales bacterium]
MKLLMHTCCGPCSVNIINYYQPSWEIKLFWYNPNIHPLEEYNLRLGALNDYAKLLNLEVITNLDYLESSWLESNRCQGCYELRLRETFKYAKAHGYEAVTTTLLASPYQNHQLIKELLERYALEFQIPSLYIDLRNQYFDGLRYFKSLNLYSQKYCGCIFSFKEYLTRINRVEKNA